MGLAAVQVHAENGEQGRADSFLDADLGDLQGSLEKGASELDLEGWVGRGVWGSRLEAGSCKKAWVDRTRLRHQSTRGQAAPGCRGRWGSRKGCSEGLYPHIREKQSGDQPAVGWAAQMGAALSPEATLHHAGVSSVEGLRRQAGKDWRLSGHRALSLPPPTEVRWGRNSVICRKWKP